MNDELCLCVDSAAIRALFDRHELGCVWLPAEAIGLDDWLPEITKAFLPRSMAESSPTWRQLATYVCLTSGDKVFAYRRGKSGGEARLHGALSIGVGGHVTLEDHGRNCMPSRLDAQMLVDAAYRELHEELRILEIGWGDECFAGLIADSGSAVDRAHLGVVYHWEIDDPALVTPREDCLADARWMTADDLWDLRDELEVWSRIAYRNVLRPIGGMVAD